MAEAKIHFEKCIQDSQDYGGDDEHMVSRVFFAIEVDGDVFANLTCDVKQTVGAPFESAPLEVSRPVGYDGTLDYAPFREAVEEYYRMSFRGAFAFGEGVTARMRHNTFSRPHVVVVQFSDGSGGW